MWPTVALYVQANVSAVCYYYVKTHAVNVTMLTVLNFTKF